MQEWKMRTREIAYLLNPAFCGRILYTTIRAYNEKSHRAFPFPLVYLVLPLVLHKIILTPSGELEVPPRSKILNREKYTDSEIAECLTKCAHIARWFEDAGKVENIYISLGVRP